MKSLFSLILFKIAEFSNTLCVNFWIKEMSWPVSIVRNCHGKTIPVAQPAGLPLIRPLPFLALASCSDTIVKALLLSGEHLECHLPGS